MACVCPFSILVVESGGTYMVNVGTEELPRRCCSRLLLSDQKQTRVSLHLRLSHLVVNVKISPASSEHY